MTDIVERLRTRGAAFGVPKVSSISTTGCLLVEAADKIDELRGLLQEVLDCLSDDEVLISPEQYPCMAKALGVETNDSGPNWIEDRTDDWKPMNAKGKRHHVTCYHDEPGITACTCGGCTCEDPPPHLAPCPRGPGGKYEIPFIERSTL